MALMTDAHSWGSADEDVVLERALQGLRRLLDRGLMTLAEADASAHSALRRWMFSGRTAGRSVALPTDLTRDLDELTFPRGLYGPFLASVASTSKMKTLPPVVLNHRWRRERLVLPSVSQRLCGALLWPAGGLRLEHFAAAIDALPGARHLGSVGVWTSDEKPEACMEASSRCTVELDLNGALAVVAYSEPRVRATCARLAAIADREEHSAGVDGVVDLALDSVLQRLKFRRAWRDAHPEWGRLDGADLWVLRRWAGASSDRTKPVTRDEFEEFALKVAEWDPVVGRRHEPELAAFWDVRLVEVVSEWLGAVRRAG